MVNALNEGAGLCRREETTGLGLQTDHHCGLRGLKRDYLFVTRKSTGTRNALAFVNTTTIARAEFWRYVIVMFTNVRILRVVSKRVGLS